MNSLTISPRAETAAQASTSLLRFATVGSVDDGKSTLVGRLLFDSKSVLSDQLEALRRPSQSPTADAPDLALLTDGLRSEREQGITIDVAYRYFATPKRRFILADTPGHVQYTRNTVTGASTADLVLVLVDARTGLVQQTLRHTAASGLLRVPHMVLAVNKMDLVDYDESVFAAIARDFSTYAASLGVGEITAIPISALYGDNVVTASPHLDWYGGPTLLEHLEAVPTVRDPRDETARFPVQCLIRSRADSHPPYRGYAGQVASGVLRVGQPVTVLPSGGTSIITGIDKLGESVAEAWAPQSVTLRLADEMDVGRGDTIVPREASVQPTREISAAACHLSDTPLNPDSRVLLKHGTRTVRAIVQDIPSRLTWSDLTESAQLPYEQEEEPGELVVNDIGRVILRTSEPLAIDDYAVSRLTGSFLLIDPCDGTTLTACMAGPALGDPATRTETA